LRNILYYFVCSFAEHHVKIEPKLRACAKADQDKVTSTR